MIGRVNSLFPPPRHRGYDAGMSRRTKAKTIAIGVLVGTSEAAAWAYADGETMIAIAVGATVGVLLATFDRRLIAIAKSFWSRIPPSNS